MLHKPTKHRLLVKNLNRSPCAGTRAAFASRMKFPQSLNIFFHPSMFADKKLGVASYRFPRPRIERHQPFFFLLDVCADLLLEISLPFQSPGKTAAEKGFLRALRRPV